MISLVRCQRMITSVLSKRRTPTKKVIYHERERAQGFCSWFSKGVFDYDKISPLRGRKYSNHSPCHGKKHLASTNVVDFGRHLGMGLLPYSS